MVIHGDTSSCGWVETPPQRYSEDCRYMRLSVLNVHSVRLCHSDLWPPHYAPTVRSLVCLLSQHLQGNLSQFSSRLLIWFPSPLRSRKQLLLTGGRCRPTMHCAHSKSLCQNTPLHPRMLVVTLAFFSLHSFEAPVPNTVKKSPSLHLDPEDQEGWVLIVSITTVYSSCPLRCLTFYFLFLSYSRRVQCVIFVWLLHTLRAVGWV